MSLMREMHFDGKYMPAFIAPSFYKYKDFFLLYLFWKFFMYAYVLPLCGDIFNDKTFKIIKKITVILYRNHVMNLLVWNAAFIFLKLQWNKKN